MAHVTQKTVQGRNGKQRKVYLAKWKEGGKTREKSFPMKRSAKSFAAEMQATCENRELTEMQALQFSNLPFGEVAEQYFDAITSGTSEYERLAPITIRNYRTQYRTRIFPYFDEMGGSIELIGRQDVVNIKQRTLSTTGSTRQARDCVLLTKAILKYGVSRGYIDEVPGADVRVKRTRQERTDQRLRQQRSVFTPPEVKALLAATERFTSMESKVIWRHKVLYRALMYFLVYTGVRISEARGFSRDCIDFEEAKIKIRQKADAKGNIGNPKSTDSIRTIPLHDALVEPMKDALASHDRQIIFSTRSGTPFTYSNLRLRSWIPIISGANQQAELDGSTRIPDLGFHAMRHSYASRLISAGANLKQLQTWMGHSDPAFTLRVYGHLYVDDGTAANIIGKI